MARGHPEGASSCGGSCLAAPAAAVGGSLHAQHLGQRSEVVVAVRRDAVALGALPAPLRHRGQRATASADAYEVKRSAVGVERVTAIHECQPIGHLPGYHGRLSRGGELPELVEGCPPVLLRLLPLPLREQRVTELRQGPRALDARVRREPD